MMHMFARRITAHVCRPGVGALAGVLLASASAAADFDASDPAATELVRDTVFNELAATNLVSRYLYRVHKETPDGSETRVMLETRDLPVHRLIALNGQALSAAQRRREDERLRGLLAGRGRSDKASAERLANLTRIHRLIQALPEAFVYQQAAATTDATGRKLAVLTFRPAPDFTAPSLELRILQGMTGTLQIDRQAKRLVRVEARLERDVDFGWGIIDHIARGGRCLLEQQRIGPDRWAITTWAAQYTSRRLLLINSHVDFVTRVSDFQPLPEDLSFEQGVEWLLDSGQLQAAKPRAGENDTRP